MEFWLPFLGVFFQMTGKIDIVEGLDASLRYQSFKAQLHNGKDSSGFNGN